MQKLDNRLKACSDYVSRHSVAADIGTDHANLAAYLIESGISQYVYACDVNDGPLEAARQTVERCALSDRICVLKSDGLSSLENKLVSDAVIAGMGGELISQILHNSEKAKSGMNLILQPMTKISFLRKWLYENGFSIIKEKVAKDGRFLYVIMNVIYYGKCVVADEFECITGALDFSDKLSAEYLKRQAEKLILISDGLIKSGKDTSLAQRHKNTAEKILRRLSE